jgi:indolepyruvate ferredoxin oxidoreductase
LPDHIRGYGHIRKRHAEHAKRREAGLIEAFRGQGKRQDEGGERVLDAPVVMAG